MWKMKDKPWPSQAFYIGVLFFSTGPVGHHGQAGVAQGATGAPAVEDSSDNNRQTLDTILLNVDKSQLKAELRTWPEKSDQSSVLTTFKIAVGKADGDKEFEGDNKTPEGIYFVQNHIDGQTLPDKYGPLAIPIDFPNPIDRLIGKTGHGIWLHGVDREQRIEEAKVTEGCVAFYNNDIKILSNWLKSKQAIVVIAKDQAGVNQPSDIEGVRQQTNEWLKAWADRNLKSYETFYHPNFKFEKFDLKSYISYKKRVFSSYDKMAVNHDRLRIVTHPKYAVSFFNQDFRGDQRYISIGRKTLYWEKDSTTGQWLIVREVFENQRFEQLSLSESELASLADRPSTRSSVEAKETPAGPSSSSNL